MRDFAKTACGMQWVKGQSVSWHVLLMIHARIVSTSSFTRLSPFPNFSCRVFTPKPNVIFLQCAIRTWGQWVSGLKALRAKCTWRSSRCLIENGPRATAAGYSIEKMAERNIIQCSVQVIYVEYVLLFFWFYILLYISCVTHHLSPYINLLLTLFVYIWENVGGRSHMHT